jgi:hypothetical protein
MSGTRESFRFEGCFAFGIPPGFIHQLPVGASRILVLHAVSYLRLNVTQEVSDMIAFFADRAPCLMHTTPWQSSYPMIATC